VAGTKRGRQPGVWKLRVRRGRDPMTGDPSDQQDLLGADVFLVDRSNWYLLEQGRSDKFHGGHFK
jgi:hypothetical protein